MDTVLMAVVPVAYPVLVTLRAVKGAEFPTVLLKVVMPVVAEVRLYKPLTL